MTEITTSAFLNKAGTEQFKHILTLYPAALNIKAETKSKPQELIKLDEWYQTALPKALKTRSPSHLTHEELINIIKWKQSRGKFRPKLRELVTMNSPRVVVAESKKAFRALDKKGDLSIAVAYLCNLKGIGPSTASAILTAYAPQTAAFMADECLAAVPEIEGIDCSTLEYLDLMKHLREACVRLSTPSYVWTPHNIELALWTHYTLLMFKPELLHGIPDDGTILNSTQNDNSNSIDSTHDFNNYENESTSDETLIPSIVTNGSELSQEASLSCPASEDEPWELNLKDSTTPKTLLKNEDSEIFNCDLSINPDTLPYVEDCDEKVINSNVVPLLGETDETYCTVDIEKKHSLDLDSYEPECKRVKVD